MRALTVDSSLLRGTEDPEDNGRILRANSQINLNRTAACIGRVGAKGSKVRVSRREGIGLPPTFDLAKTKASACGS